MRARVFSKLQVLLLWFSLLWGDVASVLRLEISWKRHIYPVGCPAWFGSALILYFKKSPSKYPHLAPTKENTCENDIAGDESPREASPCSASGRRLTNLHLLYLQSRLRTRPPSFSSIETHLFPQHHNPAFVANVTWIPSLWHWPLSQRRAVSHDFMTEESGKYAV